MLSQAVIGGLRQIWRCIARIGMRARRTRVVQIITRSMDAWMRNGVRPAWLFGSQPDIADVSHLLRFNPTLETFLCM